MTEQTRIYTNPKSIKRAQPLLPSRDISFTGSLQENGRTKATIYKHHKIPRVKIEHFPGKKINLVGSNPASLDAVALELFGVNSSDYSI